MGQVETGPEVGSWPLGATALDLLGEPGRGHCPVSYAYPAVWRQPIGRQLCVSYERWGCSFWLWLWFLSQGLVVLGWVQGPPQNWHGVVWSLCVVVGSGPVQVCRATKAGESVPSCYQPQPEGTTRVGCQAEG